MLLFLRPFPLYDTFRRPATDFEIPKPKRKKRKVYEVRRHKRTVVAVDVGTKKRALAIRRRKKTVEALIHALDDDGWT